MSRSSACVFHGRTRSPCKNRHTPMWKRPEVGLEIMKNGLGRQHEKRKIDTVILPFRRRIDENGNGPTVRRRELVFQRMELLRRAKMKPGAGACKKTGELDLPMFCRRTPNRTIGIYRMWCPGIVDSYGQRHSEVIEIIVGRQKGFEITTALELAVRHVEDTFQFRRVRSPPDGMAVWSLLVKLASDGKLVSAWRYGFRQDFEQSLLVPTLRIFKLDTFSVEKGRDDPLAYAYRGVTLCIGQKCDIREGGNLTGSGIELESIPGSRKVNEHHSPTGFVDKRWRGISKIVHGVPSYGGMITNARSRAGRSLERDRRSRARAHRTQGSCSGAHPF